MKIRFGGDLNFGDFIAVSNGNHISFGWYAGRGRGTLQYFWFGSPANAYNDYEDWTELSDELKARSWKTKKYSKGFSSKTMYKSYINAVHETRVMKVTNAEEIFTDPKDLERYTESVKVLKLIGMIK